MCSHAIVRLTVLTVLLQDPYDCFVHVLLQFCTVKAEVALERDETDLFWRKHQQVSGCSITQHRRKQSITECCCICWPIVPSTGQDENN